MVKVRRNILYKKIAALLWTIKINIENWQVKAAMMLRSGQGCKYYNKRRY
jgi:hypothetical protein